MKEVTIEDLKIVSEFQQVPNDQLEWLISQGEPQELQKNELLFNAGEPVVTCYILLEGKMRICAVQSGKQKELRILDPGQVTGYLPYSRATVTPAFCEAIKDSRVFKCSKDKLIAGFGTHYQLIEAMVHMMLSRVREFTAIQQQNEKMFALGKLSAGLAHELNNPAAAISRAAALLQTQVSRLPYLFESVANLQIEPGKIEKISKLIINKINSEQSPLSMMQQANLEDELTDWLYENNLADTDPEGLAERGFTTSELDVFKECSTKAHLPVLLEWVSNYLVTHKMADDIRVSSDRISTLVNAVKNFTFMDKNSDRQLTEIHSGIRNTLTMLNYKIRKGNITVIENYDTTIPAIKIFPGEMNQVWTNLIDNAIDAMEPNGKGTLAITTSYDERFLKVCIKDDGTGIPDEIKQNIFAPFFTTKQMGKGSGLGLDVVSRIMLQHNGEIKVNSRPGQTEFEICLPF
jgi:signal transduction histidine kinase